MRLVGKASCPSEPRARRVIAGLAASLCLWAAAPAHAAPEPLQFTTAGFVDLPGGTVGALGDSAPPADAVQLAPVTLPFHLPRAVSTDPGSPDIRTAWFRIALPGKLARGADQPLRLYVPRWQTLGQVAVYADQRLLYRSGAGPVWNGFNHPLWVTLDTAAATPQAVWIRIDHYASAGLGLSTAWVGDEDALEQRRAAREWIQAEAPYFAATAFFVIGLFALGVWVVRRETAFGLFFLTSFLFFGRTLHYHLGLEPLLVPEEWFGWMTVNTASWMVPCVYFLGLRLHGKRYPWVEWPLLAFVALSTVASLPTLALLPSVALIAPLAYLLMTLALVGLSGLLLWSAWRARSRDAMWVAATNSLNVPTAVHDLLMQNYRIGIEGVYLIPYTAIAFFGVFLVIVLRRYLHALADTESANHRLEQRLAEREQELAASYQRLRDVEHRQLIAGERERLMQDMHDGLGSSLMGALKAVEHGSQPDVAGLLRECIEDLKLAIDSLEPLQADLLSLLGSLRFRLGARLEQAGIQLRWEVEDLPALPWLDPRSALHILRVLQEVLGNAVRHSGAQTVRLATRHDAGTVVILVEDDGRGFDALDHGGRGRGLGYIERRAEAIGGRVTWTRLERGARFELALPVDRQAISEEKTAVARLQTA